MYDYEIENILKQNQNNIDSETYLHICSTSPQLDHIHYEPYGNYFEMWSNTGTYFRFTVYHKEETHYD